MDSAKIIRYQNNGSGYTEYSINVFYLGKNWLTKKRFSDFTGLDSALRGSGVTVAAELPQKNWFSKFDVDFLLKRAKALQIYLDKAIAIYPVPSLIKEFLEVEKNMLQVDLKKSRKDIRKTDKIAAIVNKAKNKFLIIEPKERIDASMRMIYQDRFPTGYSRGPHLRTKGTTSSFNSDGSIRKGTNSFSSPVKKGSSRLPSPKGSFSASVGEDGIHGSRISGGRGHADSIRLAMQTAEYRAFVEKRVSDCFSRRNYLLSYMQQEEFAAMIPTFPKDISDIMAVLSAPILSDSTSGEHAMDSFSMVIDSSRESLFVSTVGDPADPATGAAAGLVADRMLFIDPPPPSPTRFSRPVSRNPSEVEGGGLLIRRTTQDSGSNRPPGSYRPAAPAQL